MGNRAKSGNTAREVLQVLEGKLPSSWRILAVPGNDDQRNSILKIRAPRGKSASIVVQARPHLQPKDVDLLGLTVQAEPKRPVLVVAPFITPRTRERLKASGFGYADLAGNVYLNISEPGLLIDTTGAERSPFPETRERRSLKGAKAGRLIRALCDFRPPFGVRELAKRAGIDAGYVSRLLGFLDREALITRQDRGPVTNVDWDALIRLWSTQYSPYEHNRATLYLGPRGIPRMLDELQRVHGRYSVSGSWAAAQVAPVAPTRLLLCYADDLPALARQLDARPAEAGANLALATPFDPIVYERTLRKTGIITTAFSQTVADLLSGPGRSPNEAEALMNWMRENEDVWRT